MHVPGVLELTCYEPYEDEDLIKLEIYAKCSLLMGLEGGNVITKACFLPTINRKKKITYTWESSTSRQLHELRAYRLSSGWRRHSRQIWCIPSPRSRWRDRRERRWRLSWRVWDIKWSVRWDWVSMEPNFGWSLSYTSYSGCRASRTEFCWKRKKKKCCTHRMSRECGNEKSFLVI